MSNPWGESTEDKTDANESEQTASQLRTALETRALDKHQPEKIISTIKEINDVDLLKEIFEKTNNTEIEEVTRDCLHNLDASPPVGETEQTELSNQMSEDEEIDDIAEESSISVEDIAPNAMGPETAKNKEHTWRVLVWGSEGVGKTHFAYTMPQPVCLIDTEGKADQIAHKFGDGFYIWQPTNYDEARESMDEALDVLDHYYSSEDEVGTLVVDSMSIMWEWAQQKYVDKYYMDEDFAEAKEKFSAGFGGGQSDWKKIKDFHNNKFREVMLNSPYHICWTAMAGDDYEAAMNGVQGRKKPVGEKNNVYKVDHIIHIDQDEQGIPVGAMEKSGLTKYRFTGLEYPDFDKLSETVHSIEEAEMSEEDVGVDELTDYNISVMESNPRYTNNE